MLDIIKMLSAEILVYRGQERLKPKRNEVKAEADSFFFWVLGTVEKHMDYCLPAKKNYLINITAFKKDGGKWLVEDDLENKYYSKYLSMGHSFCDVMNEVKRILDRIDGFTVKIYGPDKEQTTQMLIYLDL